MVPRTTAVSELAYVAGDYLLSKYIKNIIKNKY